MLTQADLPVIEHRQGSLEDGVTLEWHPSPDSCWLDVSFHNTAREAEAEFARLHALPFSDHNPEHWRIVVWNRETPGHIRR